MCCRRWAVNSHDQVQLVKKVEWHYPPEKSLSWAVGLVNTYSMDSDLTGREHYPPFKKTGSLHGSWWIGSPSQLQRKQIKTLLLVCIYECTIKKATFTGATMLDFVKLLKTIIVVWIEIWPRQATLPNFEINKWGHQTCFLHNLLCLCQEKPCMSHTFPKPGLTRSRLSHAQMFPGILNSCQDS